MAFRKKVQNLFRFSPDILVIPECENPKKINFEEWKRKPTQTIWRGDNENKGIGIFSFSDYELEIHKSYDRRFKWVIPIRVSGVHDFNLFAIWAKRNEKDRKLSYIGQVYFALKKYSRLLKSKSNIIIGDFNSNTIWDNNHPYGNHSHVKELLAKDNIFSAYHRFFKEKHGEESRKTLFFHKKRREGFHIDYCYASKNLLRKVKKVQIGYFASWSKWSDHCPLIITIK